MISATSQLLDQCHELGFDLAGITEASPPVSWQTFSQWLDKNMHAGMAYLEKHRAARQTPESLLSNVKSLIVVGLSWHKTQSENLTPTVSECRIARYARGVDYHLVMREKLQKLAAFHKRLLPEERTRCVVDTAPILEREYAFRAGLGRFGKNTMLINATLGAEFFIGILLSTAQLEIPKKRESSERDFSPCGDCQTCLESCPTGALTAPYVLDARKCLNYWTIEHRGEIPQEIGRKMKNRLFGCDICQSVCPFQPEQKKQETPHQQSKTFSLEELEKMDESDFEDLFGKTVLYRTGLDGLKRNLAIVQSNRELS